MDLGEGKFAMLAHAWQTDNGVPEFFRLALVTRQRGETVPAELEKLFSRILQQARALASGKQNSFSNPLPEAITLAYYWASDSSFKDELEGVNTLADMPREKAKAILERLETQVEGFY